MWLTTSTPQYSECIAAPHEEWGCTELCMVMLTSAHSSDSYTLAGSGGSHGQYPRWDRWWLDSVVSGYLTGTIPRDISCGRASTPTAAAGGSVCPAPHHRDSLTCQPTLFLGTYHWYGLWVQSVGTCCARVLVYTTTTYWEQYLQSGGSG